MNYLLDSNILLIYLRDIELKKFIEENYHLFDFPNIPMTSVVNIGELRAMALKNDWGKNKMSALKKLFAQLIITDINSEDVISKYAEIDAFSQGKLKGKPLGMSARNMTKNDLWIAATSAATEATLITTDYDFDHLEGHFIQLIRIDLKG